MTKITSDDKLIWDTPAGMTLTCVESVVMEDNQEVAFTKGREYSVQSMHPIAEPAYIRLTNDQGEPHKMAGEHIRRYFRRPGE